MDRRDVEFNAEGVTRGVALPGARVSGRAPTLDEVDATRTGIWGSSYVLVVGAIGRRVRAVAARPRATSSSNTLVSRKEED